MVWALLPFEFPYYYLGIYTMNVGEGTVSIRPFTGEEVEVT